MPRRPLRQQAALGQVEVDQREAVLGAAGEHGDLGGEEVAGGQRGVEAGGLARPEAGLLGPGDGPLEVQRGAAGGDLLASPLELHRGEADLQADQLLQVRDRRGGLGPRRGGGEVQALGGVVADRLHEAEARGEVVGLLPLEVLEGAAEGVVEARLAQVQEDLQPGEQAVAGEDGFEAVLGEADAGLGELGPQLRGEFHPLGEVGERLPGRVRDHRFVIGRHRLHRAGQPGGVAAAAGEDLDAAEARRRSGGLEAAGGPAEQAEEVQPPRLGEASGVDEVLAAERGLCEGGGAVAGAERPGLDPPPGGLLLPLRQRHRPLEEPQPLLGEAVEPPRPLGPREQLLGEAGELVLAGNDLQLGLPQLHEVHLRAEAAEQLLGHRDAHAGVLLLGGPVAAGALLRHVELHVGAAGQELPEARHGVEVVAVDREAGAGGAAGLGGGALLVAQLGEGLGIEGAAAEAGQRGGDGGAAGGDGELAVGGERQQQRPAQRQPQRLVGVRQRDGQAGVEFAAVDDRAGHGQPLGGVVGPGGHRFAGGLGPVHAEQGGPLRGGAAREQEQREGHPLERGPAERPAPSGATGFSL